MFHRGGDGLVGESWHSIWVVVVVTRTTISSTAMFHNNYNTMGVVVTPPMWHWKKGSVPVMKMKSYDPSSIDGVYGIHDSTTT